MTKCRVDCPHENIIKIKICAVHKLRIEIHHDVILKGIWNEKNCKYFLKLKFYLIQNRF